MSKLLTGLMEAERKRRQLAADVPLPHVDANAPAKANAGSDGVADMLSHIDQDQAALAVRRRIEQEFASAQAAAAQLEADKSAAAALDRRIEKESAALAKAQRDERRAAELAAAAAVRAAKESELARVAMDRAAAERCAADRAAAQMQAQRAADAAARSRAAAEEDALQQTRRRVELEAEASRAAAQLKSDGAARAGQALRDEVDSASGPGTGTTASTAADPAVVVPSAVAAREANHRQKSLPAAFGRLIAAVALSMGIGLSAGFWLGGPVQAPAKSPASVAHPLPAIDPDAPYLRLDHALRAVPSATPQNLTGEP